LLNLLTDTGWKYVLFGLVLYSYKKSSVNFRIRNFPLKSEQEWRMGGFFVFYEISKFVFEKKNNIRNLVRTFENFTFVPKLVVLWCFLGSFDLSCIGWRKSKNDKNGKKNTKKWWIFPLKKNKTNFATLLDRLATRYTEVSKRNFFSRNFCEKFFSRNFSKIFFWIFSVYPVAYVVMKLG
jgi:hypothetical protein